MSDTVLYNLGPSPNNMKVRIALGYKGVDHDRVEVSVDDVERRQIIEVSGQPLTPVLVHDGKVVFDSAAIMRYVDANFDGPRLFFADRDRMREAERLERWTRSELAEPVVAVVGQFFTAAEGGEADPDVCVEASERLHELTGEIERRLERHPWLMGDSLSVVDATAAPAVVYAMTPDAWVERMPPLAFFQQHFRLGDDRDRTRDWVQRVMAHDR